MIDYIDSLWFVFFLMTGDNVSLFLYTYESDGECVCVSTQIISKNLHLTHGDDLFKATIKVKNNFNSQLWLAEQIH